VAALIHAEIGAAGAFAAHNGVVARAAERLVLLAKGVDPASVTVPEAGHAAAPAAYRAALAGYGASGSAGAVRWLLYAADAFQRGAEASPLAPSRDLGDVRPSGEAEVGGNGPNLGGDVSASERRS
jgi:hypothetical protein